MIYQIIYDISDSSLRNKLAKLLEKEGAERLQLSVFVYPYKISKNGLDVKIEGLLGQYPEEKLSIIPILKRNFYNMIFFGKLDQDIVYLTGDSNSLIL